MRSYPQIGARALMQSQCWFVGGKWQRRAVFCGWGMVGLAACSIATHGEVQERISVPVATLLWAIGA